MRLININQKVYKIIELINLGELNFRVCQNIYERKIDRNNPNQLSFWRLTANNAFNECVSILHSLLCSVDKRELRIKPVLEIKNKLALPDFERIKKAFVQYGFVRVRHQSADHKNELLSDPAGAANLLLKDAYIQRLGDIIHELQVKTCIWFGFSRGNPNLSVLDKIDGMLAE